MERSESDANFARTEGRGDGGNRGLGLAMVESLVARGAHVTVVGRDAERLKEVSSRLGVDVIRGDVADEALARSVIGDIRPTLRLLNAGAVPGLAPLHERTWEGFSRSWNNDVKAGCARMTGSVADGEDVVQDTLARAYHALSEMETVPALRPWLFQIAHNRALDQLRRYDRRMSEPLESVLETALSDASDPEDALAREQATRAAISRFVELVPAQRSAVILKDVLGHSLAELAQLMGISEAAAKAALHRGRERLQALAEAAPGPQPAMPRAASPGIARYAALFNARDWDGVRALLAEDVRLDLVSRAKRSGRREVSSYVANYSSIADWRLSPAWIDGREVITVFKNRDDARPAYFIELDIEGEYVTQIKDFRYVPYILAEASQLEWIHS
ncbi:MAG: SDR family NAD(P)-dependent oxidoreductase [Pseudomonadota bacterium]